MYRMAAAFDKLLLIVTFVRPCQQLFFAEIMRMRHFIFKITSAVNLKPNS
jgi:hypothetical protein